MDYGGTDEIETSGVARREMLIDEDRIGGDQ
jgi:hypothetical protein